MYTKKYVASDVKHSKINRVRYLFLFLAIEYEYMFFYRVMKHCLQLSVQLTYQDCFKCFGAGLRAYPVFVFSNLELWFTCVFEKQSSAWYAPGDLKIFWLNPDRVLVKIIL